MGDKVGYQILKNYVSVDGAISSYRQKLTPRTEFTIVLLFRLAMPAEIPGYALGTIRYDFRKYLLATALAELPFAVLTVYAGEAVLERNFFVLGVALILILTLLSAAFYFFNKKTGK